MHKTTYEKFFHQVVTVSSQKEKVTPLICRLPSFSVSRDSVINDKIIRLNINTNLKQIIKTNLNLTERVISIEITG